MPFPWKGRLRGGDQALIQFLAQYRAPEDLDLNITLPVSNWDQYSRMETRTDVPIAGYAGTVDSYTVPLDQRVVMLDFRIFRDGGDNQFDFAEIIPPAAYGGSIRAHRVCLSPSGYMVA